MAFYDYLMKIDDTIINIAFKIKHLIRTVKPTLWIVKKKMKANAVEGMGKDLFIILNGPSLKTQDLSVLKGKDIVFVNRGFMHPLYAELSPKYHVFVDTKLLSGEWPIEWIENIFRLSPSTKIVLPIDWYTHPKIKEYKHDNRIYWLVWEIPFYGIGVSSACFSLGIQQKYSTIYFTGFDANGLAYDMIKSSESHFYGSDPELTNMSTMQFNTALYSHAIHLRSLNRFSLYCKNKGIRVINLTNGGLLDMFPRSTIENVI